VIDPGNVVVSAAVPQTGLPRIRDLFASFSDWLIAALARIGLHGVHRKDVSDLALGEHKVGGACLYRPRGVALYSATLLVEPQLDLMERYLAHPPREPAYRHGRSHADFVGRLGDLPGGWTASSVAAALAETIGPPRFAPAGGGTS
jgi:lipoate-protein ligase A